MKRVGLFVGINDYDEIPRLSCAVNDATQLGLDFRGAQYDEVELLHDRQCNSINIVNKVSSLVSGLTPGDIFVFYFAGHGRENNGVLYLAGVSSRSDLFGHDSVSIPDLIKVTNKRGLNRLFILDCCRNDILGGSRAASVEVCSGARDIALTNAVVQNQDQEIIPPLILNSCSAGQLAFENRTENHGYFTSALLKVINDTAVNSFDLFRSNLKITGTPKPQNISWAGSFDNWRDILLFKHWDNKSGPKPDPDDIAKYELMIYKPEVEDLLKKCGEKCPSEIFRTYQTAVKAEEDEKYTAAVHFLKMAKEKLEKLKNDLPVPEKFSGKVNLPGGHILEMVQIEPGTFTMGSPENELGRRGHEKQHQVTLTKRFYLGKYPVTQKEYQAVMGRNPSFYKGDNLPVEQVSWDDAKRFCSELNYLKRDELPAGYRFDLPTEAQWEYACRAGTTTALNNGLNLTSAKNRCPHLDEVAWYEENSGIKTHPVGQKKPNTWGLYDMHGNVDEWCNDWYADYPSSAVTDPTGPASGSCRVIRGGSWDGYARYCRSAFRSNIDPTIRNDGVGFRVALVPVD